eukprot:TRINITY_DN41514_c0_g1_i1.p2 TRINITY_DN41514_c0_g1~~TRINITY_DN41514_c0_g1_i1.p2  ORF type:complete len:152 (+),score=22.27 TRINITY_DN41514_c0_g1_i1:442-897(+)
MQVYLHCYKMLQARLCASTRLVKQYKMVCWAFAVVSVAKSLYVRQACGEEGKDGGESSADGGNSKKGTSAQICDGFSFESLGGSGYTDFVGPCRVLLISLATAPLEASCFLSPALALLSALQGPMPSAWQPSFAAHTLGMTDAMTCNNVFQ